MFLDQFHSRKVQLLEAKKQVRDDIQGKSLILFSLTGCAFPFTIDQPSILIFCLFFLEESLFPVLRVLTVVTVLIFPHRIEETADSAAVSDCSARRAS